MDHITAITFIPIYAQMSIVRPPLFLSHSPHCLLLNILQTQYLHAPILTTIQLNLKKYEVFKNKLHPSFSSLHWQNNFSPFSHSVFSQSSFHLKIFFFSFQISQWILSVSWFVVFPLPKASFFWSIWNFLFPN